MRARRSWYVRRIAGVTMPPRELGIRALGGMLLALLLTACGASTPPLPSAPGGIYTNTQFQFSVAYPAGWVPNEERAPLGSPQATSEAVAIPLTVAITQTGASQVNSALLSAFTITVLTASNPAIAASIASQRAQASGDHPTLATITLANQSAWQSSPVSQQLPNSNQSATHTEYYLLHGAYEFQLSTDSIAGGALTRTSPACCRALRLPRSHPRAITHDAARQASHRAHATAPLTRPRRGSAH